jgi:hypothetical protein
MGTLPSAPKGLTKRRCNMNAQSVLRPLTRHLRREDYASAVLLANNELLDGRLDRASLIADALDEWESTSGHSKRMEEHAFCFRSVYRSMSFEGLLRRAIGAFTDEHPIPPMPIEEPVQGQERVIGLHLRLCGMTADEMDEWLNHQWNLARQVTQQWTPPKHDRGARPRSARN